MIGEARGAGDEPGDRKREMCFGASPRPAQPFSPSSGGVAGFDSAFARAPRAGGPAEQTQTRTPAVSPHRPAPFPTEGVTGPDFRHACDALTETDARPAGFPLDHRPAAAQGLARAPPPRRGCEQYTAARAGAAQIAFAHLSAASGALKRISFPAPHPQMRGEWNRRRNTCDNIIHLALNLLRRSIRRACRRPLAAACSKKEEEA